MSRKQAVVPCRLSVLLARDAPRAVILRRGPSQRVQLLLWHTDTDAIEAGQWFYGRIYEHLSDLSPDGTMFLYVAQKAKTPEREQSRTTHKWTALSRPPYFTALKLWPCGGTWQGGGAFLANQVLWLCYGRRDIPEQSYKGFSIRASFNPKRFQERSLLDGWEVAQPGDFGWERLPDNVPGPPLRIKSITRQPMIWRRFRPDHRYSLVVELYREPGFTFDRLVCLVGSATGEQQLLEETTWEDWDQRGRLVFARAGKLFASADAEGHPLEVHEIADLNENTPSAVIAPYRGKQW
jgi:hypothetical protein